MPTDEVDCPDGIDRFADPAKADVTYDGGTVANVRGPASGARARITIATDHAQR